MPAQSHRVPRPRSRTMLAALLLAALLLGPLGARAAGPRAHLPRSAARPAAPVIASPSHPHEDMWYTRSRVVFRWTVPPGGTPARLFAYAVDRQAGTSVGAHGTVWHVTTARQAVASALADGLWYLHVRARDAAGAWSAVSSYAVHIDHAPSTVAHAVFSVFAFNPQFDTQSVRLTVTGPGTLHAAYWSATGPAPVRSFAPRWVTATQPITLTWDGRDDRGRRVPAGAYHLVLLLSDPVGQRTSAMYYGLTVHYRRIVVSLRLQRLWAFDGQTQVLTTLVTTGNRVLPTPLGTFHVWGRFHPYTFHSPWPKSSAYYYPPSTVNYALFFHQGGYFIHDAAWRSAFGPGTNSGVGKPGQDYTGTHGCVNVPLAVMPALFAWAISGTPVQIVN